MKFKVMYSSGGCGEDVEINTLEELMKFRRRVEEPVIICHEPDDDEPGELEVYDTYRE